MRVRAIVLVALLALVGVSAATASSGSRVVVQVTPADALIDRPVSIVVSGLQPGKTATVTATMTDESGHRWASSAVFRADPGGRVVVAHSPALAGAYRGVDPMGLFWSMHELGTKTPRDEQVLSMPVVSTVTLRVGGATARLTRRWHSPTVRLHTTTLAHEGFAGCYWSPSARRRTMPAILVLGGSGGGLSCGGLLASHGYPELDLAYFNYKGLPPRLERIPLEYFQRALEWLARQPGVDPKRIVTWGISRGEEAALLLGTTYPSLVHGVVGYAGSNIVFAAAPDKPSWTLHGKGIPSGTLIPVEKVNGPLFLVGAGSDGLGPSAGDVESMVRELREYDRHDFVALTYPDAGHAIAFGIPNVPRPTVNLTFGHPLLLGGTPAADAHARDDSWPKLLAFLAKL